MKNFFNRKKIKWVLLGLTWVLSLILGMAGFARYSQLHGSGYTFWDNLYLTLQLIPLNSGGLEPPVPAALNIARFLTPILAAAAAIQALWAIFRQQIKSARLLYLHDHIIICGLSRKGLLLANQFQSHGTAVVIIERNKDNAWIEACNKPGMYLLIGDATEPALLEKAGIKHAHGIIAVCDDDGINVEIALRAEALSNERSSQTLHCLVHVSDPQLCLILNKQHTRLEQTAFRMELFNVFEHGARRILQEFPAWEENTSGIPHILVLGLGRFGQNLVLQLGRNWWNYRKDKNQKLEITVIERKAKQNTDLLFARYPQLRHAVHIISENIELESAEFELAGYLNSRLPDRIYICLDDDSHALKAGLILQQITRGKVPNIIRMVESGGLERLIQRTGNGLSIPNLFPFLVLEQICTTNLLDQQPRDILAQAFHEAYVRGQHPGEPLSQPDPAMNTWYGLHPDYKAKNYQQVDHLINLTTEFSYSIAPLVDWEAISYIFPDDISERMAQREHELWLADHLAEGWRYQPGEKNLQAKTNPALIEWKDLPENEREKNRNFIRNIPGILGKAGFQLVSK
ncbi:MAG: hypothetical protein CVU39_21165 [Chloroflexi bacterium HGW-Chloroflexi-10]|nr:MAG: hypothetical protein CVU39_21165 [Chloroflexi bacterium HGW-Chloroflexi-10]